MLWFWLLERYNFDSWRENLTSTLARWGHRAEKPGWWDFDGDFTIKENILRWTVTMRRQASGTLFNISNQLDSRWLKKNLSFIRHVSHDGHHALLTYGWHRNDTRSTAQFRITLLMSSHHICSKLGDFQESWSLLECRQDSPWTNRLRCMVAKRELYQPL